MGDNFKQAPYTRVRSGELQGSATAAQLPNIQCSMVRFSALKSNAGNVYLGGSGVTVPDGTTDATSGLELTPGCDTGWISILNLNLFYRICDNAGDDLTYLAME
jgi:hypothetical protein